MRHHFCLRVAQGSPESASFYDSLIARAGHFTLRTIQSALKVSAEAENVKCSNLFLRPVVLWSFASRCADEMSEVDFSRNWKGKFCSKKKADRLALNAAERCAKSGGEGIFDDNALQGGNEAICGAIAGEGDGATDSSWYRSDDDSDVFEGKHVYFLITKFYCFHAHLKKVGWQRS